MQASWALNMGLFGFRAWTPTNSAEQFDFVTPAAVGTWLMGRSWLWGAPRAHDLDGLWWDLSHWEEVDGVTPLLSSSIAQQPASFLSA